MQSDAQPTPAQDSVAPEVPGTYAPDTADTADAPPSDAVPTAAPAADEAVPEAVQEADDEGDDEPEASDEAAASTEPQSDRRQRRIEARQAAERKQQDAINAAVSAEMVARDARRIAEDALAEKTAADQQVMAQAAALLNTAEQEAELIDKGAAGDFEALDQLKVLRELKKRDAVILVAADKMAWSKVYTQVQTAKAIKGVDPSVIDTVGTLTEIFSHVEAAVEKRVSADYEGRLERQKADYESRLGRAASGMPTTETGGRAVGAPVRTFTRDDLARMSTADYKKNKAEIFAQEARGLIN